MRVIYPERSLLFYFFVLGSFLASANNNYCFSMERSGYRDVIVGEEKINMVENIVNNFEKNLVKTNVEKYKNKKQKYLDKIESLRKLSASENDITFSKYEDEIRVLKESIGKQYKIFKISTVIIFVAGIPDAIALYYLFL